MLLNYQVVSSLYFLRVKALVPGKDSALLCEALTFVEDIWILLLPSSRSRFVIAATDAGQLHHSTAGELLQVRLGFYLHVDYGLTLA